MFEHGETQELEYESTPKREKSFAFLLLGVFFALSILAVGITFSYNQIQKPPADFPINEPVVIEQGTSARLAAAELKAAGVIRSELALLVLMKLVYKETPIKASTYVFLKPLTLPEVALELSKGNPISDLVRLTLYEGEQAKQIAEEAKKVLTQFDEAAFLKLALPLEGKLFPDTYFIPKDYTEEELVTLLTTTFQEKITPFEGDITQSLFSLDEIIILASILEREANSEESMKLVSGILQNRLAIGMALQVDASLEYVLDKPLSKLSPEDLEKDSPYNTYLTAGLPPTPIGNPGLEAIEAILRPTPSAYMFYITGNDGVFYYAKDFEGHKANVARYLR